MKCPNWLLRLTASLGRVNPITVTTLNTRRMAIEGAVVAVSPKGSTIIVQDDNSAALQLYDAENVGLSTRLEISESWLHGALFASEETFFIARYRPDTNDSGEVFIAMDGFHWDKSSNRPPAPIDQGIHLTLSTKVPRDILISRLVESPRSRFMDVEYEVATEVCVDRFSIPDDFTVPSGSHPIKMAPQYHICHPKFAFRLRLLEDNYAQRFHKTGEELRSDILKLGSKSDGSDAELVRSVHWRSSSVENFFFSSDYRSVFINLDGERLIMSPLEGVENRIEDLIRRGTVLPKPRRRIEDLSVISSADILVVQPKNAAAGAVGELRDLATGRLLGRIPTWLPHASPDRSTFADVREDWKGYSLIVYKLRKP